MNMKIKLSLPKQVYLLSFECILHDNDGIQNEWVYNIWARYDEWHDGMSTHTEKDSF